MDGVPHLTQAPTEESARFEYRFKAADAGTYWYHAPYTLPGQCERGLYGILIVDEKTPVEVDHDVVLVFDEQTAPGRNHRHPKQRAAENSAPQCRRKRGWRPSVSTATPFASWRSMASRPNRFWRMRATCRLDRETGSICSWMRRLNPARALRFFWTRPGVKQRSRASFTTERKSAAHRPCPIRARCRPIRCPSASTCETHFGSRRRCTIHPNRFGRMSLPSPGPFGPPLFSVKRGRAVVLAFPNPGDAALCRPSSRPPCSPARQSRRRLETVLARHDHGRPAPDHARRVRRGQSGQVADACAAARPRHRNGHLV